MTSVINHKQSALAGLKYQRSHILLVLSQPQQGREPDFLDWYKGDYLHAIANQEKVLSVQHFEPHEVDITKGKHKPLPYPYLSLIELSLDGAEQACDLIQRITALHQAQPTANEPATWLYFTTSEKVGRAPNTTASLMTMAFANPLPGKEIEFREWYSTRHIRHALNVPALVSGQCFELTEFQQTGALAADFSLIAIYEQEGTPQDIMDSFADIPLGTLSFPALDTTPGRFAEWVYRPVCDQVVANAN